MGHRVLYRTAADMDTPARLFITTDCSTAAEASTLFNQVVQYPDIYDAYIQETDDANMPLRNVAWYPKTPAFDPKDMSDNYGAGMGYDERMAQGWDYN